MHASIRLLRAPEGMLRACSVQSVQVHRAHTLAAAAANQRHNAARRAPWQSTSHNICNCKRHVACGAGSKQQQPRGGSSSSSSSKPRGAPDITNNMDDMEDVILIGEDEEDEDEFEYEDEFEDFEDDGFLDDEGEDGDLLESLGITEEDPGPEVLTGNVTWGDKALEVATAVLERPENQNLSLYLFRVLVPTKTIEVRLDRLDDVYGSPELDDIERFSRALIQGLEAELGAEAAGEIAIEVSSPGAERTLIIPQDLERFKELPMRVEWMTEVGTINNLVLKFLDMDMAEGLSTWELAEVKANQNVKGRGLSKKQRAQRYTIPIAELERVRIYVDF